LNLWKQRHAEPKKLWEILPTGYITTNTALSEAGFTVHQIDNYLKAGDIELLFSGVYKSPDTTLSWEGAVASFARLGEDTSVGALNSLEHAGHGHYPTTSQHQTHFMYTYSRRVHLWFNKVLPNLKVVTRKHARLLNKKQYTAVFFHHTNSYKKPAIELWQSKPELAILEFLQGVPKQASFELADLLIQGLTTLSPKRLDSVLMCCNNIRVKRLFFGRPTVTIMHG